MAKKRTVKLTRSHPPTRPISLLHLQSNLCLLTAERRPKEYKTNQRIQQQAMTSSATATAGLMRTALLSSLHHPPLISSSPCSTSAGGDILVCNCSNMNMSASKSPSFLAVSVPSRASLPSIPKTSIRSINCKIALKSSDTHSASSTISAAVDSNDVLSTSPNQGECDVQARIGEKVRVKVPLKVYHVPKVPQVDLTGREGELKQYVALWKGKRISANLPYKVEFVTEIPGRGNVKFFAHLKEEEFEYI